MKSVKIYYQEDINKLTRKRSGEKKIGESVKCSINNWEKDLDKSNCEFVIIGIPEDIGVRANYGRAGASSAFNPALDSFLSQQDNLFLNAKNIFVLGEIHVEDLMKKAEHLEQKTKQNIDELRKIVSEIDLRVSHVISKIIKFKKIPIIIGGGHNNAFGNIKGSFEGLSQQINVINCDAHLDFRPLEGRHSGNGFSYAFENKYLKKYAALSIHEQYNNSEALNQFLKTPQQLFYNTYESIFIREELTFNSAIKQTINFVKESACGVELDLDSITNVPSSAKTSSGISALQARKYVYQCAKQLKVIYLHIAEGAPVLSHIKADNKTGKLIAYLISDFIKGREKN